MALKTDYENGSVFDASDINSTNAKVNENESALAGKANASHSHSQSDITGLATALAGKASASDLTDLALKVGRKENTPTQGDEGYEVDMEEMTSDGVVDWRGHAERLDVYATTTNKCELVIYCDGSNPVHDDASEIIGDAFDPQSDKTYIVSICDSIAVYAELKSAH